MVDAGFTADSFGLRDVVPVSRFTLRAANQVHASSREVFFETDRELTSLFRSGDELRLTHSCMWGTGLTLLRAGKLVVAVGAIRFGKLGDGIQVSHPKDTLERIMRFEKVPWEYRQKKPMLLPLEFSMGEQIVSIYAGRAEIGDYGIWVQGGRNHAYPSGDTYAALWRKEMCDEWCAIGSAMMLNVPGMTSPKW